MEGAAQDLLPVGEKGVDGGESEAIDHLATEVGDLFVVVRELTDHPTGLLPLCVGEEGVEQLGALLPREDLKLIRILKIHDLVADIVSRLD